MAKKTSTAVAKQLAVAQASAARRKPAPKERPIVSAIRQLVKAVAEEGGDLNRVEIHDDGAITITYRKVERIRL